jgi:hypothetical protein
MDTPFTIGIWYQPVDLFDLWASRGINTLFGYEPGTGVAYADWKARAAATGMRYLTQWVGRDGGAVLNAADDSDPNLLAVMLPDEPDGAGNLTPGQILDLSLQIRKVLPSKPIFLNIDGWKTQWRPAVDYIAYAAACDWMSLDYYPLNHDGDPAKIAFLADRVRFMQQIAGGQKQLFCAIETSNQLLAEQPWTAAIDPVRGRPLREFLRGPTAVEVTEQVATVTRQGLVGIFYFPDVIGTGWVSFDGTPPDIAATITVINRMLVGR